MNTEDQLDALQSTSAFNYLCNHFEVPVNKRLMFAKVLLCNSETTVEQFLAQEAKPAWIKHDRESLKQFKHKLKSIIDAHPEYDAEEIAYEAGCTFYLKTKKQLWREYLLILNRVRRGKPIKTHRIKGKTLQQRDAEVRYEQSRTAFLADRDITAQELTVMFGFSTPLAYQHLAKLRIEYGMPPAKMGKKVKTKIVKSQSTPTS